MLSLLYTLALLCRWCTSLYSIYSYAHTFMWLHKNFILVYSIYNLMSCAVR